MEIKLKDLDSIDFNSPELISEFNKVIEKGNERLKSMEIDRNAFYKKKQ